MTNHPCGAFQEVTTDLLDREAARLLPCPFCGSAAAVLMDYRRNKLVVRCRAISSDGCQIKPARLATARIMHCHPREEHGRLRRLTPRKPHTYQQTLDELVKAWNTRAPAASGEVSR